MVIDYQGKSFPSRIKVELSDVLIFRCSDPTHAQVGARELVCQVKTFNFNLVVGSNLAMTLRIHLIRKMLRLKSSRDDQLWSTLTWVWSGWFLVISSAKIGSLYSNPNKIQLNHMDGGVVKFCLRMVLGPLLCRDVHPPAARNITPTRFRQGWELIFFRTHNLLFFLKKLFNLYKF